MHRSILNKMPNKPHRHNTPIDFLEKIFLMPFFKRLPLFLLKVSTFAFCLLISACAFPDPFKFNVPIAPVVRGYSDGQKIFLSIDGEYTTGELPNFSGFNIYMGENNEIAKIEKRLLYISSKDITPSVAINLSEISFPTNLEFTGAFAFRLTSKANETDRNDEGVSDILTLIENKADWTIGAKKNFYFVAKAVAGEKISPFSDILKVGVPEITPRTFNFGTTETIDLGGESVEVTFVNTAAGQSVAFKAATSPGNPVAESVSLGPDDTWIQRSLPKTGFTQINQIYGANYVFFVQFRKGNTITHYFKLRVNQINAGSVDAVVHLFVN